MDARTDDIASPWAPVRAKEKVETHFVPICFKTVSLYWLVYCVTRERANKSIFYGHQFK